MTARGDRPTVARRRVLAGLGAGTASLGLAACPAIGPLPERALDGRIDMPQLSPSQQSRIGNRLFGRAIDAAGGSYRNSSAQQALRRVAEPLFDAITEPAFAWEIVLIDRESPGAWALPGGKIAVDKGLIRHADSESALAAAIAHEMGHAAEGHVFTVLGGAGRQRTLDGAALAALATFDDRDDDVDRLADALDRPLLTIAVAGYGPMLERAADRFVFPVFGRSGHDPAGAVRLLRALAALLPDDETRTTCLISGAADTRARADAIEAAAAMTPAARRVPDGTAFTSLRATFPARDRYPDVEA